ncbi:phage replisome organizer N-terminal domain-containing protein [Vagococcus carniphilus]|uniref:phage replisome organizer N-terminal domain-containing protein n=1 Tax=Vagococcus carniphilus TaxID=218144 RepID=UPI00289A8FF3|nr:phage replisome organizer N-terminal domain-containing protein [Vagococcus carniphilus]
MAEISWIKLKTTMFDDEKIRLIQSLPEADAILVIWIRLLVLAGKTNDDGLIYIQRNMPYTEEMLATLFDKPVSVVRLALVTLQQFEMVDLGEDGLIAISNWEKHQNIEGMEKIREQNRLRKAKQREKQKLLTDVTGQSRDSHATDIDKDKELDIDKEKDIDINTMSSSDEQDSPPKKTPKHKHGEFNNVLLTDEELEKLKKEFTDWEKRIDNLSIYIGSSGKKYKSHYLTILSWARKEKKGASQRGTGEYDNLF